MSIARRGIIACMLCVPTLFLVGCGDDTPSEVVGSFAHAVADGDEDGARALVSKKLGAQLGSVRQAAGFFKALGGVKSIDILEEKSLKDGGVQLVYSFVFEDEKGRPQAMTFRSRVVVEDEKWKVDSMSQTQGRLK